MILTVEAKGEEAVTLKRLRVTELERFPEPANLATVLPCGVSGGELNQRLFKVDLGKPPKVTAEPGYNPATGGVVEEPVTFPFKVSTSDPEVFYLELEEQACFCAWRLALDWVSGGRRGTTVIGRDSGKSELTATGTKRESGKPTPDRKTARGIHRCQNRVIIPAHRRQNRSWSYSHPGRGNRRNLKAVLSKAAFLHPQTSSSLIWRQHVTVVAALDSTVRPSL